MTLAKIQNLSFENLWQKDPGELRQELITIWKQFNPSIEAELAEERLRQLVFVIKNEFNQVVGISTAYKAYIKQLRNHLYALRLLVLPEYRIPGLASKLLVETRNLLESVYQQEADDPCIGIITLVENEDFKRVRNEAVWRASKMVYIGNSKQGHQVRVYYFKDAPIS